MHIFLTLCHTLKYNQKKYKITEKNIAFFKETDLPHLQPSIPIVNPPLLLLYIDRSIKL